MEASPGCGGLPNLEGTTSLVLNDFEETVRQIITLDGRTCVYRDGEGYRNALEQPKGQPEPITP